MKKLAIILSFYLLCAPVLADTPQEVAIFKRNLKKNLIERYNKCLEENKNQPYPECICPAQYNKLAKQHLDPIDWMPEETCVYVNDCTGQPPWVKCP